MYRVIENAGDEDEEDYSVSSGISLPGEKNK